MMDKKAAIQNQLRDMMRQIEMDESLSEAEKKERIKKLQDAAAKATFELMAQTRRVLSGQGKVVRDIEEDLAALDSLAARAAMLASGAHGGAEAQKMMAQIMEELRGKISKLRHWITSGDVGAHA